MEDIIEDYEKKKKEYEAALANIVEIDNKLDRLTEELEKEKENLKRLKEELDEIAKNFHVVKADILKEIAEKKSKEK
ncbi:unnamed protein product [Microthlaspi erraticum]|uniref:Uncharacterized protein n=1 Tax=Microthlaspi erraticum TaxID=1685480 RepID=A0A6D2JMC5_9BRAS|nr:unnamed protein product [Microthlaspi erraticum]